MVDQPPPKFAKNGVIETRIGQLQAKQVFPIDATAYRVDSLPIWQALRKLQECYDGQTTRGNRRLPARGKQVRKVVIAEERAELIIEP
jgi:hypothetical protein